MWVPFVSKNVGASHGSGDNICTRKKNPYDRFAFSGSAKIPGKIGRVVVGHVEEMWYALDSGAIISGKVTLLGLNFADFAIFDQIREFLRKLTP